MQKVITINLNGKAYQLNEDAYAALGAYLDKARLALKDNPDLAEILTDLEQAIAEKCQRFLGPHKSVVEGPEIAQVLEEMGPVANVDNVDNVDNVATSDDVDRADSAEDVAGAGRVDGAAGEPSTGAGTAGAPTASTQTARDAGTPKRLYLIEDGAWIGGVCNGLAAFFNIDVMIVRIIFVALAAATKGAGAAVYALLWFGLPRASTSEEEAAAHGVPFNAKEIVERATARAHAFTDRATKRSHAFSGDWKRQSREWRREQWRWRRAARAARRQARWNRRTWGSWGSWRTWASVPRAPQGSSPVPPPPVGYAGQIVAGILVPALALVSAGFFWIWAAAMMSLFVTGAIFGHALPPDLPLWAALLILLMLFSMIAVPIRQARYASHAALGGRYYYGGVAAWDHMMWVSFWLLCGWAAWEYIPEVRQFLNYLPMAGDRFREIFTFE